MRASSVVKLSEWRERSASLGGDEAEANVDIFLASAKDLYQDPGAAVVVATVWRYWYFWFGIVARAVPEYVVRHHVITGFLGHLEW